MRKDTNKGHGLLGGTVAAALVVGVMVLFLAVIVQILGPAVPFLGQLGAGLGVLVLYIIVILAIAVGVVAALIQRWREVKGGEEDEAKNTEDSRTQKREVVRGLALTWLFRLAGAALLLGLRMDPAMSDWMRTLFLVLAVVGLLSLPFSLVSLKERFQEIEGGELDEARKY